MTRFVPSLAVMGTLGLLGLTSSATAADLRVEIGNHPILPAAGQVVDLYVTGGAGVLSFDLAMQVGGGLIGPVITGVDLESGIFQGKSLDQIHNSSTERTAFYDIVVSDELVIADGWLARLTFDATGIPEGTYDLVLSNFEVGDFGMASSRFLDGSAAPVSTDFIAGTLIVVPEPAVGLMAGGLLLLGRRRRLSAT